MILVLLDRPHPCHHPDTEPRTRPVVLGQGTRSSLDVALPAVAMLAVSGWLGLVLVGAFRWLRLVPDRWQGGEAGAAVERHDRQVRGDPDGARRELLDDMAPRVSSSVGARPEDGAQRRPADRRSEADAGSAGMEGVRRTRGACRQRRP